MKSLSILLLLVVMSAPVCAARAQDDTRDAPIANGAVTRAASPESGPSSGTAFPAIENWGSLKIRLERWGCLGKCSVYKVEISGDGTVVYRGVDNVVVTGVHHGQVTQSAVRGLLAQFRKANFFALLDRYSPDSVPQKSGMVIARPLDVSSRVVSIAFDGHSKTVEDMLGLGSGMPIAVADLQDAIDDAAQSRKWVEGNSATVATLEAEGWDFRVSADMHSMLIFTAADMGNSALVQQLLNKGVAVRNVFGCAALQTAADRGDLKTVALLAKAHVPVSAPELDQSERYLPRCAPLGAAARHGNAEILKLVLELHPEIDARGFKGKTPLIEAAENASGVDDEMHRDGATTVRLLLAAGARVNLRDDEGSSALSLCHEDAEVLRILLAAGAADVNSPDWNGRTPLMNSANPEVTAVLLAAGADPYLKDKDRKTALDYAKSWNGTGPVLERWMAAHPQKQPN